MILFSPLIMINSQRHVWWPIFPSSCILLDFSLELYTMAEMWNIIRSIKMLKYPNNIFLKKTNDIWRLKKPFTTTL